MFSDDRLQVSFCKSIPKPQFKYVSPTLKRRISTGELIPFNLRDISKRQYSNYISLSRTKKVLEDISENNDFRYFLTITFNRKFVNADDAVEVRRVFKSVVRRLKYAYGGVSYVQVSEFHKDLENIHFHLLINFSENPKLLFFEKSYSGHSLYYLNKFERQFKNGKQIVKEPFKRNDCMLVVEKLHEGNNIKYLTKYLTKGHIFPFVRRFGATRDLARTRVVAHKIIDADFAVVDNLRKYYAFDVVCENDKVRSYEYTARNWVSPARGARGDIQFEMDLFNYNTKGEKLFYVYEQIIKRIERLNKFYYSDEKRFEAERKRFTLEFKNAKIAKEKQKEWLSFISELN
jgi:hypothetical protein